MKGKFVFMRVSIVSILFIFSIFFSNNIIAQSCTPPAVPYITGTSITAGWNLLSTTTHGFSSAWSQTLAATNPNKSYKLIVTGTWGIANSVVHRDAAFDGKGDVS
jgi:protein-S-isoprenylcysteine O-methyltransferase Ste14